jgi:hypothetical protein
MSATFAAGFGFWFWGTPDCTLRQAAFDSVHMIQLHDQHALPKPVSFLVTCFNALPLSLGNQWQNGLVLSNLSSSCTVRRNVCGTVTMNLNSANHMTLCHFNRLRRTILLLMREPNTHYMHMRSGKGEETVSCWTFLNKLHYYMSQTKGDVSLKAEVLLRCPYVLANNGRGDHCNKLENAEGIFINHQEVTTKMASLPLHNLFHSS